MSEAHGGGVTGRSSWDRASAANGMDERDLIRAAAQKIEAVRTAVGEDVHLMLDNHGRFSPFYAIELMHALQPYNMLFLEELVPPENPQALNKVADVKANVPLATGERLFSKWEFRELIDQQIVDIVQPDICHAGGILELKKIAAMAEAYVHQGGAAQPERPGRHGGVAAPLGGDSELPDSGDGQERAAPHAAQKVGPQDQGRLGRAADDARPGYRAGRGGDCRPPVQPARLFERVLPGRLCRRYLTWVLGSGSGHGDSSPRPKT